MQLSGSCILANLQAAVERMQLDLYLHAG